MNKTAAEEQVTKAEALLLEEEKVHEGELEQLRRKIDEVTGNLFYNFLICYSPIRCKAPDSDFMNTSHLPE